MQAFLICLITDFSLFPWPGEGITCMTAQRSAMCLPLVSHRPCSHPGCVGLPCCDSVNKIPHLQVACCGLQLDKQLRPPA